MRRRRSLPAATETAPRQTWRDWVPPWLSAVAAAAGVLITLLGINAVAGDRGPTQADLIGTSIVIGPEGIRGEGEYVSLSPAREDILIMARPEHASEPYTWVHVEAQRSPERTDEAAGIEDGNWQAVIPIGDIAEEWRVVVGVVEAGLQGLGMQDELRELEVEGPDAAVVLRAGEPMVIAPDD